MCSHTNRNKTISVMLEKERLFVAPFSTSNRQGRLQSVLQLSERRKPANLKLANATLQAAQCNICAAMLALHFANSPLERTQQNKNFVAFRAHLCYNSIEIDESLLGTWIMMLLADPGFFITSVIHELLIAVGFLKSDLFQNVLAASVFVNDICKYCLKA